MTEKDINSINRFLEDNTFNANVRIWSSDDYRFELEYTFKILGTRKMMSVGEYYDHLRLDIEIVDADQVTTQLFGIYFRLSEVIKDAVVRLIQQNYLIKVDLQKSISDLLKYFSNDYPHTVIENISVSDSFIKKIEKSQDTV